MNGAPIRRRAQGSHGAVNVRGSKRCAGLAVALVAKHLGEALLELLAGEDGGRLVLLGKGADAGVAIEQELGGLKQDLGGRLAGVEGDELDLRALLGGELQFHLMSVCRGGRGVSIDLW